MSERHLQIFTEFGGNLEVGYSGSQMVAMVHNSETGDGSEGVPGEKEWRHAALFRAAPALLTAGEEALGLIECNCSDMCDGTCTHARLREAVRMATRYEEERTRAFFAAKVSEWMGEGEEEVVRVLTLWASRTDGQLPRIDLGAWAEKP